MKKFIIAFFSGFLIFLLTLAYISKPFKLNTYKLTNGDKEVIFQEMLHSADKEFYSKIFANLKYYVDNGYKLYYEGVEYSQNEEINTIMTYFLYIYSECHKRPKLINEEVYKNMYKEYFKKGIRVDLSFDELVKNIDIDNIKKKNDTCLTFNKKQYNIYLNFVYFDEHFKNVVLKPRDEYLANYIMNSEDKKIYIQYGAAHFEGVYKILKENNYKIVSKEELQPVKIKEK